MKNYSLLILVYLTKLSGSSCPASLAGIPTQDEYGRPTCAIQYTGMGDPLPEYGCNGCMENDLNGFYIHSGAVRQAISKKFLPFGSTVIFERCQLHLFENRDFSGTSVIYGAGIHPEIDPGPRGGLVCASGWGSYRCDCAQPDLMDEDSCPAAQKIFSEFENLCAIRYEGFPGVTSNCSNCSSGNHELIFDNQEKSAEKNEAFAFGSLLVNEDCKLILYDDYSYNGETRVYTEGSYSKILSGPKTHDTCKSFAWPSYKCKCGMLEEEYLKVKKVVQDDNITPGMSHLQTVLIAVGIALIFIGVVLVVFKYHLPKQKQVPNCLRNQNQIATAPRIKVNRRPNVY